MLVTGAGGFIGSFLVEELLKKGAEVFAFIKKEEDIGLLKELNGGSKINIISGDLRNIEDIKNAIKGKEIIFHLGALVSVKDSFRIPEEYFMINSFGTLNILISAKEEKIKKIVLSSTSEVYGDGQLSPINEELKTEPRSPYAFSKEIAEKFSKSFYELYNLPISIARVFNVFGPRQSVGPLIPSVINKLLNRKRIKITNLDSRRDFVYVRDVANAFIKIAESEGTNGEIFNVGTGNLISVREVLEEVSKLLQTDFYSSIELEDFKEDKKRLKCDYKKLKEITGWGPEYSFEKGLIETIDYFKGRFG